MRLLPRKSDKPLGRRRKVEPEQHLPQAPNVYSYRASRTEQDASIGRNEKRPAQRSSEGSGVRFWVRRFSLAVLLMIVVAAFTSMVSLTPNAKLQSVSIGGKDSPFLQNKTAYQTAADTLLASSVWNRTKLTINTTKLDQDLLRQFPELAAANVTLPLLSHRPVVVIQPAQPVLILNASNGSFVIDERGKALLSSDQLTSSNQLNLVQLTDQGGLRVSLNHQALTSQNVSFIQAVAAELAARGVTVSSMTLPAAASELDVQLAGKPYFVKFNLQNTDARQQAGTFLATIAQLQHQNIAPSQYVDVRVDGRAYYK